MKADDDIEKLIKKISDGYLDSFASELDGTEFGLYLPAYQDGDVVKSIPDGYSQVESDLKITISNAPADFSEADFQAVGWMGDLAGKDSKCKHGPKTRCKHCTTHPSACRHCSDHSKLGPDLGLERPSLVLEAPELDYDAAVSQLESKREVLKALADQGFGLALLHSHNEVSKFSKLPIGVLSVIAAGKTHFRTAEEVTADETFVPNTWRFVDGALQPSGGYSAI